MATHSPILPIYFRLSWPNTAFLCFVRLHFVPTWLLVTFDFSETEENNERDHIWATSAHYAELDGTTVLHSQRGIPAVLQTMEGKFREVESQWEYFGGDETYRQQLIQITLLTAWRDSGRRGWHEYFIDQSIHPAVIYLTMLVWFFIVHDFSKDRCSREVTFYTCRYGSCNGLL